MQKVARIKDVRASADMTKKKRALRASLLFCSEFGNTQVVGMFLVENHQALLPFLLKTLAY